jgi:hypothetical protein
MANVPQERPGEGAEPGLGGWISGASLSPVTLSAPPAGSGPLILSEAARTAASLRAACMAHGVPAFEPCPLIGSGACLARRRAALGDDA